MGEEALGIQRRGAARAGGGDGLAVGVVDEVTAGEHSGEARPRARRIHDDVALVIEVNLPTGGLATRVVTDPTNRPLTSGVEVSPVFTLPHPPERSPAARLGSASAMATTVALGSLS